MRKGGRVPNRYGAYSPVPRALNNVPGRLLVYVSPPKLRALLALVSLLEWLIWPVANQPAPKQSTPKDPLEGPIEDEMDFPVPVMGTYTITSTYFETFDPGSSQLGPRPDVSYGGDHTEDVLIKGIKYKNWFYLDNSGPQQEGYQSGQFISFDELSNPAGYGAHVGTIYNKTFGQPGSIGEGSVLTRIEKRFISNITAGGAPVVFPLPTPAPGIPWPGTAPPAPLADPAPAPQTVPAPAVPTVIPAAPAMVPLPSLPPSLQPGSKPGASPAATPGTKAPPIPATAAPMQPNGRPALPPAPAPAKTPAGTTFLPGGVPLPNNGPQPTPQGTARELGKLEKKLELALAPEGPLSLLDKINRVIDQIENIKFVLDSLFPPGPYTYGAGQYGLTPVCERDENGAPLPDRVADWPSGEGEIVEVNAKLDALAQLIQFHKELKQPTCRGPAPTGEGVTVTFEQIE